MSAAAAAEFDAWVAEGLQRGWLGTPVCAAHGVVPGVGGDECVQVARLLPP